MRNKFRECAIREIQLLLFLKVWWGRKYSIRLRCVNVADAVVVVVVVAVVVVVVNVVVDW